MIDLDPCMLAVAGPVDVLACHGAVELGNGGQPQQAAAPAEDVLPPIDVPGHEVPVLLDRDDAPDFLLPVSQPADAAAPALQAQLDHGFDFLLPVFESAIAPLPHVLDIVSIAAAHPAPLETNVTTAAPIPFLLPADLSFFTDNWREDPLFDRAGHTSHSLTGGSARR